MVYYDPNISLFRGTKERYPLVSPNRSYCIVNSGIRCWTLYRRADQAWYGLVSHI